jgi:hypothetical protein
MAVLHSLTPAAPGTRIGIFTAFVQMRPNF